MFKFLIFNSKAGGAVSDVERTLKTLNGYHEDILEALRNAAASTHRSSGNTPSGSISEEILRKTLHEYTVNSGGFEHKRSSSKNSSKENICETNPVHLANESGQNTMLHLHRSQQQLHQQSIQVYISSK